MRRPIASALLLFILAGVSTPLALALSADPPHACCVRKGPHCHSMRGEDAQAPVFYAPSCADHSCCRALSASHWAHPQGSTGSAVVHEHQRVPYNTTSIVPSSDLNYSHAVRGPPRFSIA